MNRNGFAQIVPLLVIAALFVGLITLSSFNKSLIPNTSQVLSETDNNDNFNSSESNEDDSGSLTANQAVNSLIAANVINSIGGQRVSKLAHTGNLSASQLVEINEKNGVEVYEINGISEQRLLGIIPVLIEKEVEVSTQTGEVIAQQETLVNQILDVLSF